MDPHVMLQGIILFVVLPILGIMGVLALFGGRIGKLIGIIVAALFMLGFAFGDSATWQGIGHNVAAGIDTVIHMHP